MQETIKRTKVEPKDDICVIIYGSRYAERMKSFGPMGLYRDVYGKPVLETQIKTIKSVYPNAEIIIVGGYEIERILKFKSDKIRIVENQIYEQTNEIEDIRLGLNNTNKTEILTISGDLHFNKYALMNVTNESCIVYDSKHQLQECDLGITVDKNIVHRIDLSLEHKWCHICYFEKRPLAHLKKWCIRKHRKLFLFEILNNMIDTNIVFKGIEPNSMLIHKLHTPDKLRNFKQNVYIDR